MKYCKIKPLFSTGLLTSASLLIMAANTDGQLQRVPNSTLQLPPNPPGTGYTSEPAFGNLGFTDPVAIVSAPGDDQRLFIVEQRGVISVIPDLNNPIREVFLDISGAVTGGTFGDDERGLLGLVFHPNWRENRQFFIFYTTSPSGLHDRLSRFEISESNPNRADAGSEAILIDQPDDATNHNAGDLHFGPDGYLYVSLGDEGGANDNNNNSQRIDKDFFSGILRLDVDQRPGSLPPNDHPSVVGNYAVPPDNPFVGATTFNGIPVNPEEVHTEFWAVGLRNPWRMSFDPLTGELYVGDVGQGAWEEVDIITKGGNYGWNFREGDHPGPGGRTPRGFESIPPILEYPHGSGEFQGNSITGGVVYRGDQLPNLFGAYLFADYVSGNVWSMRHDGTTQTEFVRLLDDPSISAFGVDPRDGEILMANRDSDNIKRLVADNNSTGAPIPETLSQTGAFTDLETLTPNPGIVPYDLNVPFWSDGAHKQRWLSVPDVSDTIGFSESGNFEFPIGAVWIKHFELEMIPGDPSSVRRLETRFLVRNENGLYGVTYRWNDEQTEAFLVPPEGMDEEFEIEDDGQTRTQVWHYPSRSECRACHTDAVGLIAGFNAPQLNRKMDYGGTTANQITVLSQAGYFSAPTPDPGELPRLATPSDPNASLTHRVRSYLSANCSQCHQPTGPAIGNWNARFSVPLSETGIINGELVRDGGSDVDHVITPGSPEHSEILERISMRGNGQMPPLDSNVLDEDAIQLLTEWINSLVGYTPLEMSFPEWREASFESTSDPKTQREADFDGGGLGNYLEYLLGLDPIDPADDWHLSISVDETGARITFPKVRNHGFEMRLESTTDLSGGWEAIPVEDLNTFFSESDATGEILDPSPNPGVKYYRVRFLEP